MLTVVGNPISYNVKTDLYNNLISVLILYVSLTTSTLLFLMSLILIFFSEITQKYNKTITNKNKLKI